MVKIDLIWNLQFASLDVSKLNSLLCMSDGSMVWRRNARGVREQTYSKLIMKNLNWISCTYA
jgi:hypothetical protein